MMGEAEKALAATQPQPWGNEEMGAAKMQASRRARLARQLRKPSRAQTPRPPGSPVLLKRHADNKKIRKGPGLNGGRMQSPHPLQQGWATRFLSKFGHDPELAPTIMLETATGLPHTTINNLQRDRRDKAGSTASPTWKKGDPRPDPAWTHGVESDLQAAGLGRDIIKQVLQQQYPCSTN